MLPLLYFLIPSNHYTFKLIQLYLSKDIRRYVVKSIVGSCVTFSGKVR